MKMSDGSRLTKEEIEAVSEAMWDCGIEEDDRPLWKELDPRLDADLMTEFRQQTIAGIASFLAIRATPATASKRAVAERGEEG